MTYQPDGRLPYNPRKRFVRYAPRRTDDLRPDVREYVGQVFEVRFECWQIEGGHYDGETAVMLDWPPPYWVPHGDLQDAS